MSPTGPTMKENDETTEEITSRIFKKLKKSKKKIMFLFLCIKEVVDCVLDWLLYREFSALEPGLVYGPIDNSILYSLLAICCIGTVVSLADLVNKLVEQYRGKPIVNIAYTELCVVYLEDIPQLIMGFFIVFCTGEDVFFLIAKSLILLVGSLIGLSVMCSAVYRNGCSSNRSIMFPEQTDNQGRKCGGLLVIGFVVASIVSVAMIHWNIYRDRPKDLLNYVGIFVDTSDLELAQNDSEDMTWIYVFDVNDIKRHGEVVTIITTDPSHLRIQNLYKENGNDSVTDACYRRIETNNTIFKRNFNCSLLNGTEFYYRFKYLPPSRRHRLGDIQYNVRMTSTGSCDNAAFQRSHLRYFVGHREHLFVSGDYYDEYWLDNFTYDEYLAGSALYGGFYGYTFHNAEYLSDKTHTWERASCHKSDAYPHFNQDIPVPCVL